MPEKVLGYGEYTDDMEMEGMIYGSAVRTPYPRARVVSIDASKALALEGVRAVLTVADVPGKNKVGHLKKDWDTMIPVGRDHPLCGRRCLSGGRIYSGDSGTGKKTGED